MMTFSVISPNKKTKNMRLQSIRKKLKKHGYYLTLGMKGTYIAEKNSRTYTAPTLNGIYNKIFGKLN